MADLFHINKGVIRRIGDFQNWRQREIAFEDDAWRSDVCWDVFLIYRNKDGPKDWHLAQFACWDGSSWCNTNIWLQRESESKFDRVYACKLREGQKKIVYVSSSEEFRFGTGMALDEFARINDGDFLVLTLALATK